MVITTRLFRAVCYHPDIYQIITSGTDRKVGFFFLFSLIIAFSGNPSLVLYLASLIIIWTGQLGATLPS